MIDLEIMTIDLKIMTIDPKIVLPKETKLKITGPTGIFPLNPLSPFE